jgi:hypothetical protein
MVLLFHEKHEEEIYDGSSRTAVRELSSYPLARAGQFRRGLFGTTCHPGDIGRDQDFAYASQ